LLNSFIFSLVWIFSGLIKYIVIHFSFQSKRSNSWELFLLISSRIKEASDEEARAAGFTDRDAANIQDCKDKGYMTGKEILCQLDNVVKNLHLATFNR